MPLPSALYRLRSLARNLLFRRQAERELDDELRAYVALLADEHERAGLPPDEARRRALREAGGVSRVKEEVRDARAGAAFEVLAQDVRYGARALARNPGFTAAAVLTLALGIGATTAILGVVDAVLLRPLPYADAARLVTVLHDGRDPVAAANFLDWKAGTRAFAGMGAAQAWGPNLSGGDRPERVSGLRLSADMLPLLGVRPALGRAFGAAEDVPGGDRVAVIGHRLWQRHFGGRASAVGASIVLDGEPFTVIGVMPDSFAFAPFWVRDAEIFAPLALDGAAASRGAQTLRVFARLAPGATLDQARADVARVTTRLEAMYPGTNRGVTVRPLMELVVGDVRPALLMLLSAVALVLLAACANVAHLLLARGVARRRELAIRTALGATRLRTLRQLLTESLLLAVLGGAGGVLLALAGVRALVLLAPSFVPRVETVGLDGRVLAASAAITLLCGIAFGLLPGGRLGRAGAAGPDAFRDGGRGTTAGPAGQRLRGALVASEFALAVVLLVGAGLMMRSFVALRAIDPGFDPRGVAAATVSVTGTAQADPARRSAFFTDLADRAAALPGVASASLVNHLPLAGDVWGREFRIEGRPTPAEGESPRATYRVVLPGYFATMRIPVLRGRDVGRGDRAGAPPVVVVSERLAETAWPGEDPVGRRITFDDSTWVTVVGVVRNTMQGEWAATPREELFLPYLQDAGYQESPEGHYASLTVVVRAACGGAAGADCDAAAAATVPAMRRLVAELDPAVAVSGAEVMTRVVRRATGAPRFYVLLLGAFAAVALALATVGIYGVMSYGVSQRTREIGIRIALGATPRGVVRQVVGGGMRPALVGAAVGLAGAFLLTRLMAGLLYGVAATDAVTYVGVTLLLLAVALLAGALPARRAARTDPVTALRAE